MDILKQGILPKALGLFSLIGILIFPSLSLAGLEVTNPSRKYEVTTIKGENLPIMGESTAEYSVMAIEGGKLSPIPFQFDDLNVKRLIFVPGAVVEVDGKENVVEAQDELVFMYRDMGFKADSATVGSLEGAIVSEFEITEEGVSRYAYLVKGNSQRSDKVYAHYDFETGFIETDTYTMQFDPNNITVWSDWRIKGLTGTKSAPNVLDMMKARFFVRLGFFKVTLHNALIPARTIAVKNGPIRSIVEADISIGALGIDILKGGVSVTLTPQSIRYPIFAFFPKAAGALSEFTIDVTIDHVDFDGTKYKTPLGPEEPLIAGQKVSDKVRKQYTNDNANPWVAISSGHNWDMFFISRLSEGFDPVVSALYRDEGAGDDRNEPENFKGSSAEMGLRLSDIPVGNDVIFEYALYFGADLWEGNDPKKAAYNIFHPAAVVVNQL
ncbi:MAG: hypothetical protein JKY01_09105 [Pseudomonadales bacterium]|nr:hypothetical protein [Pseudomonadales bacterium]